MTDTSKPAIDFVEWPKIARFNKPSIVTEKIDGTNAQVYIDDLGERAYAGSRNKWISVTDDNAGFARWVAENHDALLTLGPGHHYGEWWGGNIQRKYGVPDKRFSLFNTSRWSLERPSCCGVVPVLWEGPTSEMRPWDILDKLRREGSVAAPGFMNPEGIVIYHTASSQSFKMTLDKNDLHKWETAP